MPQEWKNAAKKIGEALVRQGKGEKEAKNEGYAIATKQYMRKHGISPQKWDKLHK
jgi:hypothetical protein